MHSARTGYLTAAGVLVAVFVASAAWALPGREPTPRAAPAQAPALAQATLPVANPNFSAAPADHLIAGTAARISAMLGFPPEPVATPTRSNVCGSTPAGWMNANEVRAGRAHTSLRINVSVWRAGAASAAFTDLSDSAAKCASLQEDPGNDRIVAVKSAGAAQQVVGVVRVGDTLTVINSATLGGGAAEFAWHALGTAARMMKQQLAGQCQDPTTATQPANTSRDPFAANYQGARRAARLAVPVIPAIATDVRRSLLDTSTKASWLPPEPSTRYDLAPLAGADAGGGTLAAPRLIDPAVIHAPLSPEPDNDPGDEPTYPRTPRATAIAQIPYQDVQGPGCGWAFANTTVPLYDSQAAQARTQRLQLKSLVAATRDQGNWLVESASWPGIYQSWLDNKRNYADWQLYHEVLDQAKTDLARARRRYDESLAGANEQPAVPVPTSAGPTPTVAQPSPTSSAGANP